MATNIPDKALSFFEKTKYSDLIHEEWKYTNIDRFKSLKYKQNHSDVSSFKKKYSDLNKIDVHNCEINSAKLSKGIHITDLKSAIKKNLNDCNNFFNKIFPFEKNPNVALNTAYFNNGIFIYIENNSTIKNPIKLKKLIKNVSPDIFLNYRILLLIGDNVSVKFINKEIFKDEVSINSTWEINVGNNSNVEFVNISDKKNTNQILNFGVTVNKNSSFNYSPIDLSGKLIKNSYQFNLNKENSQCSINGLNILNNNDHIDNYIGINHNHSHTISNTYFYNLLNNNSTSIFYAKAIINKDAKNSEAYQTNKNMLLSEKSNIYSNPQLEIYNKDVKCSHASTTGEIDKEALHYLRTRGISYENSCNLIINGFINKVLDRINVKGIQEELNNIIFYNGNK